MQELFLLRKHPAGRADAPHSRITESSIGRTSLRRLMKKLLLQLPRVLSDPNLISNSSRT